MAYEGTASNVPKSVAVAESCVPQFEHVRASGVAHSSQNRAPCGLAC